MLKFSDAIANSTCEFSENCVFCKIIKKEVPAKIIAETDKALAFLDISPMSDGHTIIIPKRHFINFSSTPKDYLSSVSYLAKFIANALLRSKKLDVWGINYLSNEGSIAGQVVNHFHMHVIPKYAVGEGFSSSCPKTNLLKDIDEVHNELLNMAKKVAKNDEKK